MMQVSSLVFAFSIFYAINTLLSSFSIDLNYGSSENGIKQQFSASLPLELEVNGTDGTCGLPNGSATAIAADGVEPYEYLWSNGDSTQAISDLEAGIYSVTVTDASAATATGDIVISNTDLLLSNASATDETTIDANDGTAMAAPTGGTPPYSYVWNNGSVDQMLFDLVPNTYTVTVSDLNGCMDVQSVTVSASLCPEFLTEVALSHVSCFGDCDVTIAILEVEQGVAPYTYEWSTGGTDSSIVDICAGVYTVTITDANACSAIEIYEVFQPEELVAIAVSTHETALGANDGSAGVQPLGGIEPYTYEWDNGSTDQMISGLAPGSYTVVVTDANSCTDTGTVVVNAFICTLSLVLDVYQFEYACFGDCTGSASVTPVNAALPVSYAWTNGSIDSLITDLCAGEYGVFISDASGCTATGSVSVTTSLAVLANAGSTNESTVGANDGTAWAAPTGGTAPYTYAWSSGSTDSLITGLTPGAYTVTVTDANLCMDTQGVIVAGCNLTLVMEVFQYEYACFGDCTGSASVTPVNAVLPVNYSWSNGSMDSLITELCADDYHVTISDATGCLATGSVSVTESLQLLANAGSSDETALNANDGTVWAAPIGGVPPYTYLWSNGAVDSLIVGLAPGTHAVTVTDAIGCTDTQEVTIEEYFCIELSISTTSGISCYGGCDGALTVTVIGGVGPFIYLWNTGNLISTIDGLCADTYSVSVLDVGQQCTASASVTVTEPELLDFNVDEVVHVTDSTTGAVFITPFDGTPPYSFWWFGPEGFVSFDEDLTGVAPDFYTLMITDANGCEVYLDSIEILDNTTVSISDIPQLNVRVYPNPAQDIVHLDVMDAHEFLVQLYTADGRILESVENSRTLDLKPYPEGIYLLKVTSGQRQFVYRLTVMR